MSGILFLWYLTEKYRIFNYAGCTSFNRIIRTCICYSFDTVYCTAVRAIREKFVHNPPDLKLIKSNLEVIKFFTVKNPIFADYLTQNEESRIS